MNVSSILPDHTFKSHIGFVSTMSFSKDSSLFAVGAKIERGVSLVSLLETKNWTLQRKLPAVEDTSPTPSSLQFSPDGRLLVLAMCQYSPVRCWDVLTGELKWSLPKCGMQISLSGNGRYFTTGKGKSVLIIETYTGQVIHSLNGHTNKTNYTEYVADGTRVVSGCKSQIWLWDAVAGSPVALMQSKMGMITAARLSKSGNFHASACSKGSKKVITIYETFSGSKVTEISQCHEEDVWFLAFSKNETQLISLGGDALMCSSISDGSQVWQVALPPGCLTCFDLSPDEKTIALTMRYPIHEVRLYDALTGKFIVPLRIDGIAQDTKKCPASPQDPEFSPDGQWLAVACDDGKTRAWEMNKLLGQAIGTKQ